MASIYLTYLLALASSYHLWHSTSQGLLLLVASLAALLFVVIVTINVAKINSIRNNPNREYFTARMFLKVDPVINFWADVAWFLVVALGLVSIYSFFV